jgi:hypothetical protein
MANFDLEISGAHKRTTQGHVDWYYGSGLNAWATLAAAKLAIPDSLRSGLTVGVIESGRIVEYIWHPENISDAGLVLKEIDIVLEVSSRVVVPQTELQGFADSVDHNLLKLADTGVDSSYTFSVIEGGTTFTSGVVQGEINSDEGYFHRHYTGASGVTVGDLTASSTFVYIDKNLVLQQQTSIPTEQDWSRKIFIARISVDTDTNLIIGFEYLCNPIGHYGSTVRTLWKYLVASGVPFKIGMEITGHPSDLGFNIAAGTMMEYGGTGNIHSPHEVPFSLVNNVSFTIVYRDSVGATVTSLPLVWDNANTITALGSTTCVGHRIYRFSNGELVLAPGQGNYANIVLCKAGAKIEDFVLNPRLKNAVFLGWWLIEETATGTSGTVDAEFVEYTIGIQGGSSSGLSGAVLRGNNLSDLLDSQSSINNVTAVSAATAEHVLTKDTATGNAIWKTASGFSVSGATDNGLITYDSAGGGVVESKLSFNGSNLKIDTPGSALILGNVTNTYGIIRELGTGGLFISGDKSSTNTALQIRGLAQTDTGINPVIEINVGQGSTSSLVNRPALRITNGIASIDILAEVAANGNWDYQGNNLLNLSRLQFHGITTTERDALTPVAGDVTYDTTINKFQAYENGLWKNLVTNAAIIGSTEIGFGDANGGIKSISTFIYSEGLGAMTMRGSVPAFRLSQSTVFDSITKFWEVIATGAAGNDLAFKLVNNGTTTYMTMNRATLDINFHGKDFLDVGFIEGSEQPADPANPVEGRYRLWQSNGVGTGDDGDIMMKITAGGVTKTVTLVDFSVA